MRYYDFMRYYHPFPEAIPLSEAGYSRVTHPSATKNIKQAQCSPFDLHVLSVPPAFVLSQDQTLYLSCIYRCFRIFISILAITISLAITFVIFSSFLTSQDSESLRNFKGFFACSALFNFQDTRFRLSHCNFYIISHSEVFVK